MQAFTGISADTFVTQRCSRIPGGRIGFAAAVAVCVIALGAVSARASTPTPTSTPTRTPTTTPTITPTTSTTNSFAAAVGQNAQTDYVAKHFWLAFGAVALNPFDFEKVTPAPTQGMTPAATPTTAPPGDPTPAAGATPAAHVPPEIKLNTGGTSVRPYLEGGFRYRWAWLDRYPAIVAARLGAISDLSAKDRRELMQLRAKLNDPNDIGTNDPNDVARYDELYDSVDKAEREAHRAWASNQGKFYVYDPPSAWKIVKDSICGFQENPPCPEDRFIWAVPDDWTVRLGYVFDQNDSLGASTLAGASSFYAELAPGWNMMNFGLATAHDYETPIRGSINFEPNLVLTSDNSLLRVHTRAMFGPAFAFGVPLSMLPGGESALAPEALEPAPVPIIEFMVRLGPVLVDSPSYIDSSSKLVEVSHEQPDFSLKWGYGMDAELNVPLGWVPGYIMLRGSLNAGIEPSSWVLQAGYTVPLWSVVEAIAPLTTRATPTPSS